MYRIGIIGVGHVGSHIAKEIISQGLADEIYIYERNLDFANAQALDLHQSTLLGKDIDVKVSTLDELTECDIVMNTASGKITDGNRLEELKETGRIIEEIFTPFKNKFKGIIINVSNPCDIATYLIHKVTGIDFRRIIGTGTLLDSLRFKEVLARKLNVRPSRINALVLGEHGESQVNIYSNTYIDNLTLNEYTRQYNVTINYDELSQDVRKAGWDIFRVKHCTEFGIAASTAYIVNSIKNDIEREIPFSHAYNYNNELIYISTLAKINKDGYMYTIKLDLSNEEVDKFKHSCDIIANAIRNYNN